MLSRLSYFVLLIFAVFIANASVSLSAIGQTQGKSSKESYQESIGQIGDKIKSITKDLNSSKAKLRSERDKLLKTERKVVELTKNIEQTSFELAKTEHEQAALKKRITKLNQLQQDSKLSVSRLMKARYKKGKPNYLKSVLSQENPYAVGRLANYHGFLTNALRIKYQTIAALGEEALELEEKQRLVIEKLSKEKQAQADLKAKQVEANKQRALSVAKLDKKVSSNKKKLVVLKKDRERLQSLLTQLQKQAAELKRIDEERAKQLAKQQKNIGIGARKSVEPLMKRKLVKGGFIKQKGRLQYPVTMLANRKYGSRLPKSGMRAEGHFFMTGRSVPVKSIFRGRVLFSDFLKGYGQLIIIDHGDNHISLYGHNDKLLKRVGETVETNEIIAKSGITGGLKTPGLYFEIRNNATPVDPAKWCK